MRNIFIYSISSDLVERSNRSQLKNFWNNNNCNVAILLNLFPANKCKKTSSWRNVKSACLSNKHGKKGLKILMGKYLLKNSNKIEIHNLLIAFMLKTIINENFVWMRLFVVSNYGKSLIVDWRWLLNKESMSCYSITGIIIKYKGNNLEIDRNLLLSHWEEIDNHKKDSRKDFYENLSIAIYVHSNCI